VYVVLFKDGKVSAPVKINTAAGGQAIEYEWGGRFVMTSSNNQVCWSEDGAQTWTVAALPSIAFWNSGAYGDGVFILTGHNNSAPRGAKSIDGGQTWKEMIPPTTGRVQLGYGDGVFVALGWGTTQAARSEDGGETWEAVTLPVSGQWKRVGYGSGVFISLDYSDDSNTTIRSEDGGETWEAVTLPVSTKWTDASYGNGVFVLVGDNAAAKSEDGGETWTEVTSLSSPDYYWSSVAYGNGVFVALDYGKGAGSNKAVWSVDGETWTDAVLPSSLQWYDVEYGVGVFVATNIQNTGGRIAARSEDGGRTWTEITLPTDSVSWPRTIFGECP
jgi:hypothetical protein